MGHRFWVPLQWCHPLYIIDQDAGYKGLGMQHELKQFVHTPKAIEPPTNSNFEAFGGPKARARWAWRPLCGSPWVLKYPYCH